MQEPQHLKLNPLIVTTVRLRSLSVQTNSLLLQSCQSLIIKAVIYLIGAGMYQSAPNWTDKRSLVRALQDNLESDHEKYF